MRRTSPATRCRRVQLRGIDIIIAAGSTGFMANPVPSGPFSLLREGDTAEADYPTVRKDSEGSTVLVVNSDQLYRYEGNLRVEFDHRGRIVGGLHYRSLW